MFGDERLLLVLLTNQDGQTEAENEEQRAKPDCCFLKNTRGAGTEDLIRHASTKCGAKTFLLRALHQNDQSHQNADEDEYHEQQVDANGEVIDRSESHGRGTMGAVPELVKRGFSGICEVSPVSCHHPRKVRRRRFADESSRMLRIRLMAK